MFLRRLSIRLFRYQSLAWAGLFLALVLTVQFLLPGLQFRFHFRDVFAPEHPVRVSYEAFQRDFGLGPRVVAMVDCPEGFSPELLSEMRGLEAKLERLEGVRSVLSPLDLREPKARGEYLALVARLREEVSRDPEALARALAHPDLTRRWVGTLYDARQSVFVLTIVPHLQSGNPRETSAFMGRLEGLLEEAVTRAGGRLHLSGLFFVTQEMIRVTAGNQGRLLGLTVVVLGPVLWVLFGNFWVPIQVFGLLTISVVLGFAGMGLFGLPINFMSGNLPILILVLGTADILHILSLFSSLRVSYGPRGAALRAARRTMLPNFLTTLSTFGCILLTAWTDLHVLQEFSLSLALGIVIVYGVTIVYGPLLLVRSGLEPGRGAFFSFRNWISTPGLARVWLREVHRPSLRHAFLVFTLACLFLAGQQRVDSNWFRRFQPGMRLSRTLDFAASKSLPVTTIELTLPARGSLDGVLRDPLLREDVRRIRTSLETIPGVHGVVSAFTLAEAAEEDVAALDLNSVPEAWRPPRRDALRRRFLAHGAYDAYFSRGVGRLRLVVGTDRESSADLRALGRELLAGIQSLDLKAIDPRGVELTGQMLYWTRVIDAITETFLSTFLGSLVLAFFCFLLITRRIGVAALAMIPNLLPLLAMFGFATLCGFTMNENLCFLVALSLGISVDDTLHFLHHYLLACRRGASTDRALVSALRTVGAPIVITSVLLVVGFLLCLAADILSIAVIGLLVVVSVVVALFADLLWMPSLLLLLGENSTSGEKVETAEGNPGFHP